MCASANRGREKVEEHPTWIRNLNHREATISGSTQPPGIVMFRDSRVFKIFTKLIFNGARLQLPVRACPLHPCTEMEEVHCMARRLALARRLYIWGPTPNIAQRARSWASDWSARRREMKHRERRVF